MHFSPQLYLDPGSGSFIVQIAIAALLAIGVAVRAYWGKIKVWFGVKPDANPDDDDETN
jgi:hypothetical protein